MSIEIQGYVNHSLELNSEEQRLRAEAVATVPEGVIDMHGHIGLADYSDGIDPAFLSRLVSVYPYFPYEEHLRARSVLWGDRQDVRQVVFTFPFRGIDIRAGNEYVQNVCATDTSFIPFLTGDPYDNDYTLSQLDNPTWKGLKMYTKLMWEDIHEITKFFPVPVLEKVNELGLPIVLHLPHNLMQDVGQLVDLAGKYTNMTFQIAHFGIARGDWQEVRAALEATRDFPNIVFETSFYTVPEVIAEALRIVGPGRIVYGSDVPLDLVRAEFVPAENGVERLLTDYPYHWTNPDEQTRLREETGIDPAQIPNIHFTSLFALLEGIRQAFPDPASQEVVKRMIFVDNPRRIMRI